MYCRLRMSQLLYNCVPSSTAPPSYQLPLLNSQLFRLTKHITRWSSSDQRDSSEATPPSCAAATTAVATAAKVAPLPFLSGKSNGSSVPVACLCKRESLLVHHLIAPVKALLSLKSPPFLSVTIFLSSPLPLLVSPMFRCLAGFKNPNSGLIN